MELTLDNQLWNAVMFGDVDEALALIARGANKEIVTNYQSQRRQAPVLLAIEHDNPQMLDALLKAGASPTPTEPADVRFGPHAIPPRTIDNLMHFALENRALGVIRYLLDRGADINESFEGETPLTAALHDDYDVDEEGNRVPLPEYNVNFARDLIEAGADVSNVDAQGVMSSGLYELVPLLVQAGVPAEAFLSYFPDPKDKKEFLKYITGSKRVPLMALRKERKEARYAEAERRQTAGKRRRRRTLRKRK